MKVGIYVRVSTEKQDYDNQIELCKKHCEIHEHEIYKIYKDVYTGSSTSRPEFNQLLEDMRRYKFKAIVVSKLDRIGRSLQHLLSLFNEFSIKGVDFISVTQSIDTSTSSGKLQMQILGAFAEYERNIISERTKEGLRGKVNVGKRGKDKRQRRRRWKIKPTIGGVTKGG
jgi:DNA invertase Pin-like site-specific DNA recombinase|tara:strand:+ start:172 stop:681 length:510 start_codon:yes stop_codon:yes gene_type:complete